MYGCFFPLEGDHMKLSSLKPVLTLFTASVLLLISRPGIACAHLVTTGMGPVYDGIGHLLLTPEDLVPVIAIALYAGLCGKTAGRYAIFLLPSAWLLGGFAGLFISAGEISFLPMVSFLLFGFLIAADVRLPDKIIFLLISVTGFMYGLSNGEAMAGGPGAAGLMGIAVVVFIIVAVITGTVISFYAHWHRVVVRVLGSWIAAVGFLLFGWMVKGRG